MGSRGSKRSPRRCALSLEQLRRTHATRKYSICDFGQVCGALTSPHLPAGRTRWPSVTVQLTARPRPAGLQLHAGRGPHWMRVLYAHILCVVQAQQALTDRLPIHWQLTTIINTPSAPPFWSFGKHKTRHHQASCTFSSESARHSRACTTPPQQSAKRHANSCDAAAPCIPQRGYWSS